MAVAVKFENVSKRFTLHHQKARSFQELFVSMFKRNGSTEEFWALKDVSFEILRGESIGIIGRNGSGKSTALKLISRILEPTSGKVTVTGRVSALLELGAGFHPDLTGKENVYLNGSLLGISRGEIDRKYEEIVEFSELQQFIDTPVKHYSSGMYMRLAFAIATSVDPDILITDEVLAVGDESFQRKCLERMHRLRQSGKTVVMVSHAMDSVAETCDRVIWLVDGQIRMEGRASIITQAYLDESSRAFSAQHAASITPMEPEAITSEADNPPEGAATIGSRWGSHEAEIVEVKFLDEDGNDTETFGTGRPFSARIRYMAHSRIDSPVFGIAIHKADGTHVSGPNTKTSGLYIPFIEGEGWIDFTVPQLPLLKGEYLFSAAIYDQVPLWAIDHHDRLYPFRVGATITEEANGAVYLASQWLIYPAALSCIRTETE